MTQREKFEEWWKFNFVPSMYSEFSEREKNLVWMGWIASTAQRDSEEMANVQINLTRHDVGV